MVNEAFNNCFQDSLSADLQKWLGAVISERTQAGAQAAGHQHHPVVLRLDLQ